MLGTIVNLFGKSPFAPLQRHMETVAECVESIPVLMGAMEAKNYASVKEVEQQVCEKEHIADTMKNHIRTHLPKSLFLPIDRHQLLEILAIQDNIADCVKDIAVLSTLKELELFPEFKALYFRYLDKNIEAFHQAHFIIKELQDLLESSFGGLEADRVRLLVELVSKAEHEADLIQRELLIALFSAEPKLTFVTFGLWLKIFAATAGISDLSEKLAHRIAMTLELR